MEGGGGAEAYLWADLALYMAAEGVKWLAVLVVLAFFAFVAILLHLMFQLTRRWKKLREAAMVEADLIKARKQGPKWDAQEILPGIWLGSFPAAIKDDELRRRNITHIISIGAEFTPVYPDQFSYLVAFAMDCPGQNVMDYFPHTNRFIDAAISSGSAVLVHWYGSHHRHPLSLHIPLFVSDKNDVFYDILAKPEFPEARRLWQHTCSPNKASPAHKCSILSKLFVLAFLQTLASGSSCKAGNTKLMEIPTPQPFAAGLWLVSP